MWIIGKDEDKKDTHVPQCTSFPSIFPGNYTGKLSQTLVAVCNTAPGTRKGLPYWTRFVNISAYINGFDMTENL